MPVSDPTRSKALVEPAKAAPKGRNNLKKNVNPKDFGGPQRPLSAYFKWADDRRGELIEKKKKEAEAKGEKIKITEVGKELSENWKALDESVKNEYSEKVAKEKSVYESKLSEWKQTQGYKDYELAKKKLSKDRALKSKKANDDIKLAGMPKRPQNAYFQFSQSIVKEAMAYAMANKKEGENHMTLQARYVKEKYAGLSAEQKQVWADKAAAEKVKYEAKMEEFKKSDAYKKWETDCGKARGTQKRKSSMKKASDLGGEKKQKTEEDRVFDSDDSEVGGEDEAEEENDLEE